MSKPKSDYADLTAIIARNVAEAQGKRSVLKNLDLFVLDNSLRESTVGQLRGHTIDNKWGILEAVKNCGFKNIIVSAFSHVPRVDDMFVSQLSQKEQDMSPYYAFTEIGEGEGLQDTPVGMRKMKEHRIENPVIEIDLATGDAERNKNIYDLLKKRIDYAYENLAAKPKIFVNLRDFPFAMESYMTLVFDVVKYLATLPADRRIMGIIYEEPTGRFLPETLCGWTEAIRKLMDDCNWKSGHLLVHIHEKWRFAEVTQLDCLSSGANGIWASICEEGAALGHACSTVSIMNMVRLGNTIVQEKYNCTNLRNAATTVTQLTTGLPPHPKMPIYGARALDLAFDFGGIAGGQLGEGDFDLAEFFGVETPIRISTLASAELVQERLIDIYGENEKFTIEIANKMKEVMIDDLTNNRKEEYTSDFGIAVLFDRAGGKLTEDMCNVMAKVEPKLKLHEELIKKVREIWDEWDNCETVRDDDCLEFYSFYNGFMSPYFGCYECEDTRKGLQAIDMDLDGKVDWNEFKVYLYWALRQYPDTATTDDLLSIAFQKGLIPAMQDEILQKAGKKKKGGKRRRRRRRGREGKN